LVVKRFALDADIFCVYNLRMTKKKRGRPPKVEGDGRQQRLDLRVSEAEKEAFKLAAEDSQQDLSAWIRIQLHRAAAEVLGHGTSGAPSLSGESNAKHD
jgi:hypothetical protein